MKQPLEEQQLVVVMPQLVNAEVEQLHLLQPASVSQQLSAYLRFVAGVAVELLVQVEQQLLQLGLVQRHVT